MGRRKVAPPRELPHINISLKQSEGDLHRAILALCNEAFGWGLSFDQVEVGERESGG